MLKLIIVIADVNVSLVSRPISRLSSVQTVSDNVTSSF